MAKKKFYGVAGINGYGVYNNYNKVLESRPYVKGFMVKGFPYCREAKIYAVDTYKQLAYGTADVNGTYEIRRINRFYHKNSIRGQKNYRNPSKRRYSESSVEKSICPFFIGI